MTTDTDLLERITVRADVFGGKPIIRDMRIAVEHVLGMLAAGDPAETILDEYPDLEPEDVQACLLFAASCPAGARNQSESAAASLSLPGQVGQRPNAVALRPE